MENLFYLKYSDTRFSHEAFIPGSVSKASESCSKKSLDIYLILGWGGTLTVPVKKVCRPLLTRMFFCILTIFHIVEVY